MAQSAGFEVHAGELEKAAEQFRQAARQVTEALDKFMAATSISPSAFGALPASDAMRARYKAFREQVEKSVTTMAVQLGGSKPGGGRPGQPGAAGKLEACAHNYRACEAANTLHRAG